MDLNITDDVSQSLEDLEQNVANQLGDNRVDTSDKRRERQEAPQSPAPVSSGRGLIRRKTTPKRKTTGAQKETSRKRRCDNNSVEIIEESDEGTGLNSDDFPKEDRPDLFQDDRKFNKFSYETAAKICWEFKQLREKKAMKVCEQF